MSGIKNLANAMANDKSFSADGLLSRSEAGQYVPQGSGGGAMKHPGKGKKAPKMGKSSPGGY